MGSNEDGIIGNQRILGLAFTNAYKNLIGGNAWESFKGNANGLQQKILWESCKATLRLTSQSPASIEVTLRLLMIKTTEREDYTTAGAPSLTQPQTTWAEGLEAVEADQTADVQDLTYIGAKPTDAKKFNMRYKVIKDIKMKIDPGHERKVTFHFHPNRVLDREYQVEFGKIRGMQFLWMHTVHGISGDSANTLAAGTVTTTPAKFVGTFDYEYSFRAVSSYPRIQTTFNNLDTADIGVGTSVLTIADQSGTVVDNNVTTNFA